MRNRERDGIEAAVRRSDVATGGEEPARRRRRRKWEKMERRKRREEDEEKAAMGRSEGGRKAVRFGGRKKRRSGGFDGWGRRQTTGCDVIGGPAVGNWSRRAKGQSLTVNRRGEVPAERKEAGPDKPRLNP